jgi:hypothetical protein
LETAFFNSAPVSLSPELSFAADFFLLLAFLALAVAPFEAFFFAAFFFVAFFVAFFLAAFFFVAFFLAAFFTVFFAPSPCLPDQIRSTFPLPLIAGLLKQ